MAENQLAQQFTGLPIKALIGAPLIAAAAANGQMAMDQTNFLMSTCFEEGENEKDGMTPIMVNLNMTNNYVDQDTGQIEQIPSTIEVPLMTLIPLNQLAVDDVSVSFEMEIKTSSSEDDKKSKDTKSQASGKFSGGGGIGPFSVHVSGSVSSSSASHSSQDKHYASSKSATYNITAHASQLPLAMGVTTIIQAYAQNIKPIVGSSSSGGK